MAINRIKTGGITDGTIQSGDLAPGTIANDRLANTSITINGTSIALGASGEIVAGTDWQAVTVADGSTTLNAVAGRGYFLDTNNGIINVTMPSSPVRGDTVIIADYSGTFGTNNCIISFNNQNVDSTSTRDIALSTNDTIAEFVYVDAAKGWLVKYNSTKGTTPGAAGDPIYNQDEFITATGGTLVTSPCGSFRTHIFTGDGCFAVTAVSPTASAADYLVVAGGGAGAAGYEGAGGAGGLRLSNSLCLPAPTTSPLANCTGVTLTATTYPITVGAGAAGVCGANGGNGSNSVFSTITSTGGGGGSYNATVSSGAGASGGSGGGGSGIVCGQPNTQPVGYPNPLFGPTSSGNTPPTSPPQGTGGGAGFHRGAISSGGGGGGGAATAGSPAYDGPVAGTQGGTAYILTRASGGNGGSGTYIDDNFIGPTAPSYGTPGPVGSTRYFGGGGGGGGGAGAYDLTPIAEMNAGGVGGGGQGGTPNCMPTCANRLSTAGTANTGGGGGGRKNSPSPGSIGASGGSGIVIIRYRINNNN